MILDQQQKEAVQAPLENIFILAGAGSGKTRVIVERINYIIKKYSVSPKNILAITYTRKAANEMRERIQERIGIGSKKITLCTIHAFCHLQLYRFGDRLGWQTETMSIFSENESRKMLDFTLDELGYMKNGKFKKVGDVGKRMVDKAFNRLGSHGEWPENEDVKLIMETFFRNCKQSNVLTYNMIITEFLKLLCIKEVRELIRDEYKHVIVDEVQDTSRTQWDILKLISPETMFCVGDIRQSIMSFAGSDSEYTFEQIADYDKNYEIQNNYRSSRAIVKEGNRIMNDYLPMIPTTETEGKIHTIKTTSENIQDALLYLTDLGYNFGDIALLCRAHRPLKKSVDALRFFGADVFYPKEQDSFDKHPHTTIIHAYLSLQLNPYDMFSFLIIAEWVNLDQISIQQIKVAAKFHSITYSEACFSVSGLDLYAIPWNSFNQDISSEIILNLAKFELPLPQNISEYFRWYAVKDMQFHQETVPENHVQALSIHQSKGLEFPAVILIGASEGILPSKMCKSDEEIEEEKRLYYVAATRAIDVLVISPRPGCDVSRFVA